MEIKSLLLACFLTSLGRLSSSKYLLDEVSQTVLDAKADLARSFLQKELEESGENKVVNVTHTHLAELNVSNSGENVRIFRSADKNFFFTGSDLLQLQKKNSPKSSYVLNTVQDVRLDEGAVFFKNAEWNGKTFLVVCYQSGNCEVRVSASSLKEELKIRINTNVLPLDVTFFSANTDFFLVFVLDPVTIYKWTGTYFNEEYRLDTTGAQSVAVIQDGDKSVIIVAQNLGRNQIYSKVFIRQHENIELFQLLPTQQALRVIPFDLEHGKDVLHYIFILNNIQSSSIFWWTGKEFVLWKKLDKIYGQRIVYIGELGSRTFFFISDQNKLYVYHPTTTTFDLMQIILFDQNVVGVDLRKENDQNPMLVALTGSPMEPFFKVNLLLLKVILNYSEKSEKSSDKVQDCLVNLKLTLDTRRENLKEIFNLVVRNGEKLIPSDGNPPEITAENLIVGSLDEVMVNLAETIEDMETRMRNLNEETLEKARTRKYHVRGDLTIERMDADGIDVEILNESKIRFENVLSVAKDQNFREKVRWDTLAANSLVTPSLNGVAFNDILLRNKDLQRITGDFTLNSLIAHDIKFGPSGRLNEISVSSIVVDERDSEKPIQGRKTFAKLKARQIEAKTINDVPADEWLSKILPSYKEATEEEPLNFTSLSVGKLWISKLNGIPWEEFLSSIYLPVNNGTIKGDLTVSGTVRIGDLKAKKINGVSLLEGKESMKRSVNGNSSCQISSSYKAPKSLPFDLTSDWDDSFLKEILSESDSEYENDVIFFPAQQELIGNVRVARIHVRNPVILSDSEVNLANFTQQYWMKDEDQVINVPVEFPNGCSINNLANVKTINGKAVDAFVRIDRPNEISREIRFDKVQIIGNVTIAEHAEQKPLNLKELNNTSAKAATNNIVEGSKRFLGTLRTKRLGAITLNGMDVTDSKNLLSEDFERSDNLEVSELIIEGDLAVKNGVQVNSLNSHNFNETISSILTWDDPEVLSKARFESLKVQNLQVDSINGLNLEDKLPTLSESYDRDVSIIIEGNLKIQALHAKKVNGVNFDKFIKQVFMKNESETIRGEKTFKETVTITGNLQGTLNTYNVTELEKTALSKSKPQIISGTYTVEEFKANNVEAEYLDGVPADDLLFQDHSSEQIINSDVVFNSVDVAGDIKASDFMKECNLKEVGKIDFENVKELDNLLVRGSITWESSRDQPGSLNYFLSNVVFKNKEQSISGFVTFAGDVTVANVTGSRYLNNIDLAFIAEDAIYKSRTEQEIRAPLTFKGPVKVKSINIESNVLVDTINNIDITDIGQRLVKKNVDTIVTGRKVFANGFSASHFNAETINGQRTNQIVFYDDVKDSKELFLPPTTFKNLVIFNDLTLTRVNGHRLSKIMEDRLLKTPEDGSEGGCRINGAVRVKGNVIIKGNAEVKTINDVNLDETIFSTGNTSSEVITGDVEFLNDISIDEKLEVDFINGKNLTELYAKALMVDGNFAIEGNIEFLDDITVDGYININDTLNSCDLDRVISMDIPDGTDKVNEAFREQLKQKINILSNLTATINKPLLFMYLEETTKFDLQLPSIHGSTFNQYNDGAEFNIYGMNQGDCGLPADCYCPTQTNIFIQSLNPPSIRVETNSTRFFKHFDKELQVEVTVTTTTMSYSSRCRKSIEESENEYTSISWRNFETDETIFEVNVETGFLSDVKFFRLGDSIYAVMAFYFHPYRNETNNLHTVVYEIRVNNKTLEKVDEIPSTGVQVLEVFWTMKGVILVVGNSFDSERFTDSVNSGVYRFNEFKNKFELLRFVKTHGILAIKSMRYKKSSFIFFIQKQSWPLLILKYNQEYDNYYFSQKLDTTRAMIRSNFLSVSVISTGIPGYSGDVFIGIVLSDDSFRLFKYKHIEGFVEESYQGQNNVRLLHPFWFGSSQYILAGSSLDFSKIYQIVEQGR